MEQLGLYPLLVMPDSADPVPTYMNATPAMPTLHQFENALASMTALMYWGGMYLFLTVISPCSLSIGSRQFAA
jgi:hypothetical protein